MSVETTANPWDRRPCGESKEAYRAFLAYRDLGAGRSVVEAYRQSSGKPSAKQATGTWNHWARANDWADRAGAWDAHLRAEREKGIERSARDEGAAWERRRVRQALSEYRVAQQLFRRARELAALPVVAEERAGDGSTILRPIRPRDLKEAAGIALAASRMAWEAIDRAMSRDGAVAAPGVTPITIVEVHRRPPRDEAAAEAWGEDRARPGP